MAKARALDKRRKSIRNIRKITRTMELIATAKFKQAMNRAIAAGAYTDRITRLVADLAATGAEVSHPLLEQREATDRATLLILTGNRGMCGGYNSNVLRETLERSGELDDSFDTIDLEVSGKKGIGSLKFRRIEMAETYTEFEDRPTFAEVEALADRYLEEFLTGKLDRLDVSYTRFVSISKQEAVVETLLPLGSLTDDDAEGTPQHEESLYEFLPSAESILEEVIPTSFKVRLFKCFLDAAVSEQIARMVAMKAATENADDMIRHLSMTYNRARQSQITGELLEIIGGADAVG